MPSACGRLKHGNIAMIWNLDSQWLILAVATASILSFFFGMAMEGIMGKDGFGPIINSVIICVSFFATVYICNLAGISLRRLEVAVPYGLTGSFFVFALFAVSKALLKRFMIR
jgi:hypothetical protein